MKASVLNYRVIVEPDYETGTNNPGFSAFCPTLGLADDGDTVEEALKNIKKMIIFHLKCLKEEGEVIPSADRDDALITNLSVDLPTNFFQNISYA